MRRIFHQQHHWYIPVLMVNWFMLPIVSAIRFLIFQTQDIKAVVVTIPYVPVKATVWPIAGDNSDKIQKVIDSVSVLPPDAYGFRGAILLKMGLYQLDKPLYIKASGVVLRGEGMSDIGTILFGKIPKQQPAQGPGRGGRPALDKYFR